MPTGRDLLAAEGRDLLSEAPPIQGRDLLTEPKEDSLATSIIKEIPGAKIAYPEERKKFWDAPVGGVKDIAKRMYENVPDQGFMLPGFGGAPPSGPVLPGKETQELFKDDTKVSMITDEVRKAAEYAVLGAGKGLKTFGKAAGNLLRQPVKREALTAVTKAVPLIAEQGLKETGKTVGRAGAVSTAESLVDDIPELTGMAERVKRGYAGEAGRLFETPIRMFEKLKGNAKQQIYDPLDDAAMAATREGLELKATVKGWKKTPGVDQKKIGTYLVDRSGEDGKKILKNMGKTVKPLSEQEKAIVGEMDVFYEGMFNRINEARVQSGLKPMGKVDNYYTFFKQLDWLTTETGYNPFIEKAADIAKKITTEFMHPNSTHFRFAKKRTKNAIPVDLNAFDSVRKYAQSALDHIHLSPEIAKARQLIKPIKDTHLEAYTDITKWLDFAAGIQPNKTSFDKPIRMLTQNNAMGILSMNVRSAIIQPSSLVNTFTAAGPKHTLIGLYDLAKQAGSKKARDFVWKNSNLPGRKFDVLIDSMASPYGKVMTKAADWGTKPLQVLDMLAANASWSAFYSKATKALKMSDKEAFRYANDMVIKSQASGSKLHISEAQRSAVGKALTSLQTFVINDWAFLTQDVLGLGKNVPMNAENLKKVFYYISATSAISWVYEDKIGLSSPYGRPVKALMEGLSEENPGYYETAKSVGKEFAERVPVIGNPTKFDSGFGGPLGDTLRNLTLGNKSRHQPGAAGDIVSNLLRGEPGEISPYSLETVGKTLGIPGSTEARKIATGLSKGNSLLGSVVGTRPKKREYDQWGNPK